MLEVTLARYPQMTVQGTPSWVPGAFVNQLKTLPATLGPRTHMRAHP